MKNGRFGGLLGINFPDTAAQNDPVITLGVSGAFPLGKKATGYLNPKTVLLKDNTLLGLGIGVQARVSDTLLVLAEVTPLLTGNNTRSTDNSENGKRERRAICGIGLRYAPANKPFGIDIGYATGTGRTTGSSLTPGLGGAGAFYAGLFSSPSPCRRWRPSGQWQQWKWDRDRGHPDQPGARSVPPDIYLARPEHPIDAGRLPEY